MEVQDGAGQERQGEGTRAEQERSGKVHHDSRKLEEFVHVERPEVYEEEWQRVHSHVASFAHHI